MPITGTFAADFSNFSTAVDNAEVKLRSFQEGSTKVEAALARMTDSFSGRKLIQDATEMVASIDKIGGASKLTEQELAKVGKTVEEASAKMRAMGVDVPAGFTKITEASGHTTESMGLMSDAAGTITTAFAGAFTAEAIFEGIKKVGEFIVDVTKSVMEYSITLRNLSLQTGIGVENLQVLGAAVKDFGVDSDQLGKAIFQLGRRIAGNDESAANAFHLLGLSIKDFKTTAPEEVFLQVERRMASMGNTFQTATASSELFGARLGASLIAASYNLDSTIEEIRKTNTVMSVEAVHAAAEFSESIDHLKLSLLAMAGNALQPAMTNLDRFVTNLSSAKGRVEDLAVALTAFAAGGGLGFYNVLLTEPLGKARNISPAGAERNSNGASQDPETFMLRLRQDALETLDAEQLTHLGQLKEMGQLTEKNAAGIGVSVGQFKLYEERLKAATAATTELKKSQAELDAIALAGYEKRIAILASTEAATKSAYGFAGQIANLQQLDVAEQALSRTVFNSLTSVKDRAKVVEESIQRHLTLLNQETVLQERQAQVVNAAVVAELEASIRRNAALGRDAEGHLTVSSAAETLRLKLLELQQLEEKGIAQTNQIAEATEAFARSLYDDAVAQDKAYAAQERTSQSLERGAAIAQGTAQSFDGLTVAIAGTTTQMAAYYAASSLLSNIGTPGADNIGTPSGTGAGNMAANVLASIQTLNRLGVRPGTRAGGGPVSGGSAYVVGERGPELFTPGSSGVITPHGGGGPTIQIYITQPLGTPAAIAAAVDQALMARQRNTGQRLPVS